MQALYAHGPKDLRLGDAPDDPLGPGEVRIRMARGGICGSDLHYFNHGGFGTVRLREPMILGHEVSGHVTEIGEAVEGLKVNDLVAVSPSRPCGACTECLRGLPNQCLNMRFYGSAMPFPHIQGAFRESLITKAHQCVKADSLTPAEAAMAEPLAVCLHGVAQAGRVIGKRVLVTGCGPIGVLVILAARRAGASEIIATDITDTALDRARAAGADVALNTLSDPDALAPYSTGKGAMQDKGSAVDLETPDAQAATSETSAATPSTQPKPALQGKRINTRPKGWDKVDVAITLGTKPGLQYDRNDMMVKAGSRIKWTFVNRDDMLHNLVVVKPGQATEVGNAALELGLKGERMGYVPDSDQVLYHSGLVQPGTSETIYLYAPEEPGTYEYVCTFPGHHLVMRGVLRVVE